MTYVLPTDLYLSVVRAAATMSLHIKAEERISCESFSLVLRASHDTNIVLSTRQKLSDTDIHLTLSTEWRAAQEVDSDLAVDDVGLLAHSEGERGEPFIHGRAMLASTTVVASLLCAGVIGKVRLVLPTVPFESRTDTPYVWGIGRPNMLRIRHLEVSAIQGKDARCDG